MHKLAGGNPDFMNAANAGEILMRRPCVVACDLPLLLFKLKATMFRPSSTKQ